MRRCANATGAGMTASHLLPQIAGFAVTSDLARVFCAPSRMAITNDLAGVFCRVSQMASSHLSCIISNESEVRS